MDKDIVLVADYHDRETQFRWFDPTLPRTRRHASATIIGSDPL